MSCTTHCRHWWLLNITMSSTTTCRNSSLPIFSQHHNTMSSMENTFSNKNQSGGAGRYLKSAGSNCKKGLNSETGKEKRLREPFLPLSLFSSYTPHNIVFLFYLFKKYIKNPNSTFYSHFHFCFFFFIIVVPPSTIFGVDDGEGKI